MYLSTFLMFATVLGVRDTQIQGLCPHRVHEFLGMTGGRQM